MSYGHEIHKLVFWPEIMNHAILALQL